MQAIEFEKIESDIIKQKDEGTAAQDKNYLVEAATPLFSRVSQMRYFQSTLSTSELLQKLQKEVEIFEEVAEEKGFRYETITAARYCLCTLLDESAAKNGWANQEWSAHSLLVTFHNETWGGEQFFQLLDRIKSEPYKNINLIELMYYCLVLGYMGKYQVLNNGKLTIEQLKKDLEKIIKQYRNHSINDILIQDDGNKTALANERRKVPLWVVLVGALAATLMLYAFFNLNLGQQTSAINSRINALKIKQTMSQPIETSNEKVTLLAPLLKNEIDNNLIQVTETPRKTVITILGDELFTSGSDTIRDRYFPVLATVSQVINNVEGQVIVSGFTDDQPISNFTYPSNWHLSQGRADAVKGILLNYITDETRVRSEGKGEENPVVPNDSSINRGKNRRVEITVYVKPGSRNVESTPGVRVETDLEINRR